MNLQCARISRSFCSTKFGRFSNAWHMSSLHWPGSGNRPQYLKTTRDFTNISDRIGTKYLQHHHHHSHSSNFLLSHSRLFSCASVLHGKDPDKPQKEGIVKKFKKMAKDYWYVLIPVHVATSIVWFGGFYMLTKSGVDIISVLEFLHVPKSYLEKLEGSEAGYLALSYACYKVATPARYTVTVGGTTYTIVKLEERGLLKKSSEVADTIKDKKDEMKEKMEDKKDEMKEKYQEKYDDFKEQYDNAWQKFSKTKRK